MAEILEHVEIAIEHSPSLLMILHFFVILLSGSRFANIYVRKHFIARALNVPEKAETKYIRLMKPNHGAVITITEWGSHIKRAIRKPYGDKKAGELLNWLFAQPIIDALVSKSSTLRLRYNDKHRLSREINRRLKAKVGHIPQLATHNWRFDFTDEFTKRLTISKEEEAKRTKQRRIDYQQKKRDRPSDNDDDEETLEINNRPEKQSRSNNDVSEDDVIDATPIFPQFDSLKGPMVQQATHAILSWALEQDQAT